MALFPARINRRRRHKRLISFNYTCFMSLQALKTRLQQLLARAPSQRAIIDAFPDDASLNRHHHLAAEVALQHRILPSHLQLPEPLVDALGQSWRAEIAQRFSTWPPAKQEAWNRVEESLTQSGTGYDVLHQIALGYATAFHLADKSRQHFRGTVVDACARLTAHTSTLLIHQLERAGCADTDIMTIFGQLVQTAMVSYRRACTQVRAAHPGMDYLDTGVHDVQPMFKTLLNEPEWFPNADPAHGVSPATLPAADKLRAIEAKTATRWGLGRA